MMDDLFNDGFISCGVPLVELAVAGVDRAKLARIDDEHLVTQLREEALDLGAVRADFEGDPRTSMFLRKTTQAFMMIGDGAFVDDFPVLIEHTNRMLFVSKIEADGDEWDFRFRSSRKVIMALKRQPSLPSHLIVQAAHDRFSIRNGFAFENLV